MKTLLLGYSIFILIYFFLVNTFYLAMIISSYRHLFFFVQSVRNDVYVATEYTTPISVLVPAYNEQETIIDTVLSLLKLNYPQFEIIVVNDGSRDETLSRLIRYFKLRRVDMELRQDLPCEKIRGYYSSFEWPELVVVDKENGGKSDALNAGINASRYPLFCSLDADSILEKNALLRLVSPYLQNPDTVAVGGIVRIANGCTIKDGEILQGCAPSSQLASFQVIEYLRAFLTNRIGWESINGLLIISGAFGLFKKSAVVEAGGYSRTIGEDMELTLRLHRIMRENKKKYRVYFASDAVCWTQAPEDLKGLSGQRVRWHRGLIDSLLKHRVMLLNPRYGTVGMLSMPYYFFVEMLGPVIEGIGYLALLLSWIIGLLSPFFIWVFAMAFLYGLFFSLSALLLEEISYRRYTRMRDTLKLIFLALIEQVVYRPLTVFWRIKAFFNYRRGKNQWGTIERKSFNEAA